MRFVPSISASVIADIQTSDLSVQTALQQLSSGQRVAVPSDDPAASATLVQLQAQSANIDQYTANAESALSQAQSADSIVSSVVSSLNQGGYAGYRGRQRDDVYERSANHCDADPGHPLEHCFPGEHNVSGCLAVWRHGERSGKRSLRTQPRRPATSTTGTITSIRSRWALL